MRGILDRRISDRHKPPTGRSDGRHHQRIPHSLIFNQISNCRFQSLALVLAVSLLSGCGSHIYHFVEPGETLYSISWAYGHDYREIAQWNEIQPPYVVKRGQRLRVAPPPAKTAKKTENSRNNNQLSNSEGSGKETISLADKQVVDKSSPEDALLNNRIVEWRWPTRGGKVVQSFDARDPGKQGVDVAGQFGQPIYTAAPGRVVYSGGGLSHYGKLIIVKHNETFLSAYAHNKRLLVKEGELLKSGQLIAEMGSTGTNNTKLHFEIRRNGKPVDPLRYLPKSMQ
ncbi:peptidoglycan DD-metalloendopeptidase family protein [Kaarinaea lacus]